MSHQVYRWSNASYLEKQDMLDMSGPVHGHSTVPLNLLLPPLYHCVGLCRENREGAIRFTDSQRGRRWPGWSGMSSCTPPPRRASETSSPGPPSRMSRGGMASSAGSATATVSSTPTHQHCHDAARLSLCPHHRCVIIVATIIIVSSSSWSSSS